RRMIFGQGYARSLSHQFILQNLPLPFIELENGSVESTVGVLIQQGHGVVLLVGKEADDSSSTVRSSGLAQSHREAADLPALLAERNVLNGTYVYLHGGASAFSKLQLLIFDRQFPFGIVRGAFETQEVGGTNLRRWGRTRWSAWVLGQHQGAAPEQEDKVGSPIDRAVRTRCVFRRNSFAIHLFSPSLSYLQASLCQSGVPNSHPDVISIQTIFPIRQGSCQTSRVLNLLSSKSKWLMHNNASGVKLPGCGHCRVFGQQCSKACGQNVVLRLPYRAGSATRSLYTSRSLLPLRASPLGNFVVLSRERKQGAGHTNAVPAFRVGAEPKDCDRNAEV